MKTKILLLVLLMSPGSFSFAGSLVEVKRGAPIYGHTLANGADPAKSDANYCISKCRVGDGVIGFNIQSGLLIDNLGVICRHIERDDAGNVIGHTDYDGEKCGGPNGGKDRALCPNGSYVKKIGGRAGNALDSIEVRCAQLDWKAETVEASTLYPIEEDFCINGDQNRCPAQRCLTNAPNSCLCMKGSVGHFIPWMDAEISYKNNAEKEPYNPKYWCNGGGHGWSTEFGIAIESRTKYDLKYPPSYSEPVDICPKGSIPMGIEAWWGKYCFKEGNADHRCHTVVRSARALCQKISVLQDKFAFSQNILDYKLIRTIETNTLKYTFAPLVDFDETKSSLYLVRDRDSASARECDLMPLASNSSNQSFWLVRCEVTTFAKSMEDPFHLELRIDGVMKESSPTFTLTTLGAMPAITDATLPLIDTGLCHADTDCAEGKVCSSAGACEAPMVVDNSDMSGEEEEENEDTSVCPSGTESTPVGGCRAIEETANNNPPATDESEATADIPDDSSQSQATDSESQETENQTKQVRSSGCMSIGNNSEPNESLGFLLLVFPVLLWRRRSRICRWR